MTTFVLTNDNYVGANNPEIQMAPGDVLYIEPGAVVANTTSGFTAGALPVSIKGLDDTAGNPIYVWVGGQVAGAYPILSLYPGEFYLTVAAGGSITADFGEAVAIDGPGSILNDGSITSEAEGILLSGSLINNGKISAVDAAITTNAPSSVVNNGSIIGTVDLAGNATFDSTLGAVTGQIQFQFGTDTIIGGVTGGDIAYVPNSDEIAPHGSVVVRANPTQAAANNAAQTTIDGGLGNNWLYGDGAFTTFDSGDNEAGAYTQIFGGVSQMAGVSGYANNTVSYAAPSTSYQSAYIDLLHGDTYMCTAANANGAAASTLVFEDYLSGVPNVVGASGGDVILCDSGVDRVTGGGGADVMVAGTGAGSQDTFVYTALTDSPLAHHDVITGFKVGVDKIDLSALDMPLADILLSYGGNGGSTIYVEKNPTAGFNASTDMILSVVASTSTALSYKDIIG